MSDVIDFLPDTGSRITRNWTFVSIWSSSESHVSDNLHVEAVWSVTRRLSCCSSLRPGEPLERRKYPPRIQSVPYISTYRRTQT